MKGQVMRSDDRRRGPHSLAHRRAIAAGQARARWSGQQRNLASLKLPHELVPIGSQRTADALNRSPLAKGRIAKVGDCHWCFFFDIHVEHRPNTEGVL